MKNTVICILTVTVLAILNTGCEREQNGELPAEESRLLYGFLEAKIIDSGTKEPVPARVYAIGSNDSLYFAESCIPYEKPQFLKRIGYSGEHFTAVDGAFTVKLPVGAATIRIERGKEFEPIEETVVIEAGQTIAREFMLNRWIDMASRGWYSGDLHVHRSLGDLGVLMIAEDLNVTTPQTVWGLKREPGLDEWLAKADASGVIRVDDRRLFSVLGHEIERFRNSAVLFHHTGKTVLPVADIEERGLPNMRLIENARAAGGYVEAEKPWWPESHIDIAAGRADFTGIANNHFTYKSYLPEHPRNRTEFGSDYAEGVEGYAAYVLDLYYAYLNCGFRVMPTAGSASGVLPNPLGYNRVYVKVDGGFTYDSWFAALKAGRCFVINGPLLVMTVNGSDTGDTVNPSGGTVRVRCEVSSLVPLDRLEIVRDGGVVLAVEPELAENATVVEADIPVTESGWLVARCFERRDDTVRFAQTAPVFVEVQGREFAPKRYAVEYFLRKTNELVVRAETGEFESDEARNAAMDVFMSAKFLYEDLLKRSQ